MIRPRPLLVLLLLLLAAPLAAHADEVRLRGGTRLHGVVLERGEKEVRLLVDGLTEVRLAAADVAEVAPDPEEPAPGRYLAYREDADGTARLRTAVTWLLDPATGRRLALVGMVHIADRDYYRRIQEQAEASDVVLYEAVKPADAQLSERKEEAKSEGIGKLQSRVARWLGLEFQIDDIAYDRPQFVHADVTIEELAALLGTEAGDGDDPHAEAERISDRLGGLGVVMHLAEPLIGVLEAAGRAVPSITWNLKRKMAQALGGGELDLSDAGGSAAPLFDVLISKRNDVVLRRLHELPPRADTVAVLYGAGHMRDLEQRITSQMGFRRIGAQWLDAWVIPPYKAH
jgi:hypothetical protein